MDAWIEDDARVGAEEFALQFRPGQRTVGIAVVRIARGACQQRQ
jgi:hypothetical protein